MPYRNLIRMVLQIAIEPIYGKAAREIEQQTRADPESRLPHQVHRMRKLEQFKEIKDTYCGDEQTTDGIGHGMKNAHALDKEYIDKCGEGI